MDSAYTIVVPDSDILARLCGTNDSNLRLIEAHLGVPVYTRGNEISVAGQSQEVTERFKHIIDRIIDEVSEGENPDSDMVYSILTGFGGPRSSAAEPFELDTEALFASAAIKIPGAVKSVYPKSINQAKFIRALRTDDVVFCSGPAGSGKTYLAVAEALRLLATGAVRRLILTRPVVEAGENLGYLPGDFEQKISPYLRPLFDAIQSLLPKGECERLSENGVIEIAPLAYMRGRTLENSILILDEAQNTTREQMKMFLTRIGSGSKVFVTGDITQIDLPRRTPSGLVHALRILSDIDGISVCSMDSSDIVRNPLVRKIVQAYEHDQKTEE